MQNKKNLSFSTLFPVLDKPFFHWLVLFLDKITCIKHMNDIYSKIQKKYPHDPRALVDKFIDVAGHKVSFDTKQISNIPKTGSCIIIANHPTLMLDHSVITHAISKIRRDYKFTANSLVKRLTLFNEFIFPVHVGNEADTAKQNFQSIRECIKWLEAGHVLITYPGARPSTLSKKTRLAGEAWSSLPALLAKKTQAPIIPMKIILQEPWHHCFLKKNLSSIYNLLLFRVIFYFVDKPIKLIIGESLHLQTSKKNKAGQLLKQSVEKL